jgi:hypothetical protein
VGLPGKRRHRGPHRPTQPPAFSTMPLVTPFDVERHGVHDVYGHVEPHMWTERGLSVDWAWTEWG